MLVYYLGKMRMVEKDYNPRRLWQFTVVRRPMSRCSEPKSANP